MSAVVGVGVVVSLSGPRGGYPGKAIGVKPPHSGRVRMDEEELAAVVAIIERIEGDDRAARRVVETVALLHADGVPRWVLRVPDDLMDEVADDEDAEFLGFAGLEVDRVVDRLCAESLLAAEGDLVRMDPRVAAVARVRADRGGRASAAVGAAGGAVYAHATELRSRANRIAFRDGDASASGETEARARVLLDHAVTLACHTGYRYDRALDAVLQLNACLAELGLLSDAWELGREMAALCERNLPRGHSVSHDAAASVEVLRKARRDGGLRPPGSPR